MEIFVLSGITSFTFTRESKRQKQLRGYEKIEDMKKLGQHFLINKRQLRKFVEALELKTDDTIVEIGPGHGEITKEIIERLKDLRIEKFKIIAIEKDERLIKIFKENFRIPNIEIIRGDVLKTLSEIISNLSIPQSRNYKLVGNVPFYLTGHLLRVIAELKLKPRLVVLIIQREVAQRIIAEPPQMNLLAASVQFWAEPEIIDYISKRDFRPAPKVDSAVIALTPIYADNPEAKQACYGAGKQINAEKYYKLIRALFKQPRKTILNNLKPITNNLEQITEKLKLSGINPSDRPQNLHIEQLRQLSTLF